MCPPDVEITVCEIDVRRDGAWRIDGRFDGSAFRRGEDGAIHHTYSTYARGVDMLNGAYHLLDLTSKGRDEAGLAFTMEWVRRRGPY